MKITVLVEDGPSKAVEGLVAEFGLSLLVEAGDCSFLFDTGSSGVFEENAEKLGLDLTKLTAVVLSHQHFDHGGGLSRILEGKSTAPIYLRKANRRERFFRLLGIVKRSIGVDLELLHRYSDRLRAISEKTEIAPGVFLLTDFGRDHPKPRGNARLWAAGPSGMEHDNFDHELTMVLQEDDGLVVLTGCSHNGVLNMVDGAQKAFPGAPVKAVVGGFHLMGLPFLKTMSAKRAQVETLARDLGQRCHGPIVTGHCTGDKAYSVLHSVLGSQLQRMTTGATFQI